VTAVGLWESVVMVMNYEKIGKLLIAKLTSGEELFREEYGVPHPFSWCLVGLCVIMFLWTLNKLRASCCRGKKREPPIFNRIDVDDISTLFKTIK